MKPIPLPVAELKTALQGLSKITPRRVTLPVLGAIKIERTKDGWITLTATDLDHFATVRLEQPSPGEPASVLIPQEELVKISKSCGKNDTLAVWSQETESIWSGFITYSIGSQMIEHRCGSFPQEEFPEIPRVNGESAALPDSVRSALQEAFECASTDETRLVLNGAYLDVSKPEGHYVVATDGRQLFSSNSFKLKLSESLVIPWHKFLSYREFANDGEWLLTATSPTKDDPGWLRLDSRRWTLIGRQIEGNYPNWRQVIPDARACKTTVELEKLEEIIQIIQRLPCHEEVNHTISIEVKEKKVWLLGKSPGAETWTRVEIHTSKVMGKDVLIALNRHYLTKALSFGLSKLQIIDEMCPMRLSQGGRQMIVMPIRPDCGPTHQTVAPAQPATAPADEQPAPAISAEAQPQKEETMQSTTTPAKDGNESNASNGNGHTAAGDANIGNTEPPLNLTTALLQVEEIKGSYRQAIQGLNSLTETLKQVQRDRRASEKEVQSVRTTLEKLQSVRL